MRPGGWTLAEQAQRVAALIEPGSCVNLGIGMPTAVADALPSEKGVVLFCENGIINYRAVGSSEEIDPDVIDAGSAPVALKAGAAVVGHDMSFALARSGRLDVVVLGAYQVSARGDLANWKTPGPAIDGVGGAMDLAVGAKRVVVMMRHVTRTGEPKIVRHCTLPLTAHECVGTIVTDLAVIDVKPQGLVVREMAPEVTMERLRQVSGVDLSLTVQRCSTPPRVPTCPPSKTRREG